MEKILCVYCGDLFDPSPRHKNQVACKKAKCQKAKKADWQRHKMKTDPIYMGWGDVGWGDIHQQVINSTEVVTSR